MKNEPQTSRNNAQVVWGVALVIAGLAVFVRIPQVMPQLAEYAIFAGAMWFIRFCFYLMGIILIGGGAQKIIRQFKLKRSGAGDDPVDPIDS